MFASGRLLMYQSCKILRCIQCGQLRTYPEPCPNSLQKIYSQESVKYALSGLDDPERKSLWKSIAEGILDAIKPFALQRGRLLDVGCNYGDLLFVARDKGWSAEGLEINAGNAYYLQQQGFTIYTNYIETEEIEGSRYDAIIINHVLEHIPFPNEFLIGVKRVLKPGGAIFIGVPCFWGPIPLLLKRDRWYGLVPEEHIWQFSVPSLKRLLMKNGFIVEQLDRSSSGFHGRFSLYPKDMARWSLYKTIQLMKLGDMMSVIATKSN